MKTIVPLFAVALMMTAGVALADHTTGMGGDYSDPTASGGDTPSAPTDRTLNVFPGGRGLASAPRTQTVQLNDLNVRSTTSPSLGGLTSTKTLQNPGFAPAFYAGGSLAPGGNIGGDNKGGGGGGGGGGGSMGGGGGGGNQAAGGDKGADKGQGQGQQGQGQGQQKQQQQGQQGQGGKQQQQLGRLNDQLTRLQDIQGRPGTPDPRIQQQIDQIQRDIADIKAGITPPPPAAAAAGAAAEAAAGAPSSPPPSAGKTGSPSS